MDLVKDKLLNKEWRMKNLYSVASKEGGATVKFVPNKAQQVVLDAMAKHKRIIVLKSRQLGITTAVTTSFLDDTLFQTNAKALSILQTQQTAIDAFDNKVRFAWENLDSRLKAELGWIVDTERANQLAFNFGAGMSSKYSVSTSGRSGTFQRVHVSEFGPLCAERPLDAKEVITGTFPAVPQDGLIIIESTSGGEVGSFPEMWNDAVLGKNGWHPIFLDWRYDESEVNKAALTPEHELPVVFQEYAKTHELTPQQISYYYSKFLLLNKDWTLLRQDYPTVPEEAFQGSGERLFDPASMLEYGKYTEDGVKQGNYEIFTAPKEGHVYVIGADGAEGVGKDSSVASVWDVSTIKPTLVATYVSDAVSTDDFALIIIALAKQYNNAVIAPESNYPGNAIIPVLREKYDEDRIFRETDPLKIQPGTATKLGFNTNGASKPVILENFTSLVREFALIIPSKSLVTEMRICPKEMMRQTKTSQVTAHYDMIMASAIALYAIPFSTQFKTTYTPAAHAARPFDPHAAI